jgi:hypothetical protein
MHCPCTVPKTIVVAIVFLTTFFRRSPRRASVRVAIPLTRASPFTVPVLPVIGSLVLWVTVASTGFSVTSRRQALEIHLLGTEGGLMCLAIRGGNFQIDPLSSKYTLSRQAPNPGVAFRAGDAKRHRPHFLVRRFC